MGDKSKQFNVIRKQILVLFTIFVCSEVQGLSSARFPRSQLHDLPEDGPKASDSNALVQKTVKESDLPQLARIDEDIVKTGPIVIIDQKTLFVPSFYYSGGYENVHFWIGKGEPSSSGSRLLDDNGSSENLHRYNGKNMYLKLPDGYRVVDIDYFSIWSEDDATSLGHTYNNKEGFVVEAKGLTNKTEDGKDIVRLPKCCRKGEILQEGGKCQPFSPYILTLPNIFHDSNATHFNNETMESESFVLDSYQYFPDCSARIPLDYDIDKFFFLKNSSLVLKSDFRTGVLNHGEFCLDYSNYSARMDVYVCIVEKEISRSVSRVYFALTIASAVCFAGSAVFYYFILKVKDIHKKCFIGYAVAMSATFICYCCMHSIDGFCVGIGFIFQFSIVCSFTWLAILCWDIYYIIQNYSNNTKKGKRLWVYIGIAIGVPVLSVLISLIRTQIPDIPNSFFKPHFKANPCQFDETTAKKIYFFFPMAFTVLLSAGVLIKTKLKINKLDKTTDYFWIEKGNDYKFIFWHKVFLGIIMLLWLIVKAVNAFLPPEYGVIMSEDYLESSLGIIYILLNAQDVKAALTILLRKCCRHSRYQIVHLSRQISADNTLISPTVKVALDYFRNKRSDR